jgi:hypothetical protein
MAIITEKSFNALNKLTVEMSINLEEQGATISYHLSSDTENVISFGSFNVDEEFYLAHATDKQYVLNYVVEQLQLTLV